MRGWMKWLAVAALASGCILSDGGTNSGGGGGGGNGPPLVVRNNSSTKVCYINVSAASESQWGPDQLGPQETLDPGHTKGWNLTAAGEWDIRLQDCQRNSLVERRISVGPGGAEFTYP